MVTAGFHHLTELSERRAGHYQGQNIGNKQEQQRILKDSTDSL